MTVGNHGCAPVVTRFFCPPLMPRIMLLPTGVSWHTCKCTTLVQKVNSRFKRQERASHCFPFNSAQARHAMISCRGARLEAQDAHHVVGDWIVPCPRHRGCLQVCIDVGVWRDAAGPLRLSQLPQEVCTRQNLKLRSINEALALTLSYWLSIRAD